MSTKKPSAIDGISYIPSDSLALSIRKLTFKENRAFGITDVRGEISRERNSELGIYYNDTRYLNAWETLINGVAPVPLSQELRHQGATWILSMTNRDLPTLSGQGRIPRDTLLIRRILCLHEDTLFEIYTIRNFSGSRQTLQVDHWAGVRFEDIFEIRGMKRESRGKLRPAEEPVSGHIHFSYVGLDGKSRSTHIQRLYQADKIRLSPYLSGYFVRLDLDPKEIITLRTVVSFDSASSLKFHGESFSDLDAGSMMLIAEENRAKPKFFNFNFETDNAILGRAMECAATDISMLLTQETESLLYPYAGIPWFSAPFGRDGIITAYQLLPWAPEIARGVLDFVFQTLGSKVEPFTDEEPGKVFHELRRGEMASLREIPFVPYFGSVDATPLALILLHEYLCWTEDRESLDRWWPAILRALEWIDNTACPPGSLFLEYSRKSEKGLSNQGWKDSHDSIMHSDGSLADAPIRLCEVQAYAYRARVGLAEVADWMGKTEFGRDLRLKALRLKALFQEQFWDSTGQFIVLALDGKNQPCRVVSSNMGHCLWGGIVTETQARSIATKLLSPALFSGHGIRTLSDEEKAYNPLSYHNGSVWPHDNSIIVEGLRRYDCTKELSMLVDALTGVVQNSEDFRLPELFCGFRKRAFEPPVPYEVACKPQAWSAGSLFLILRSALGISKALHHNAVTIRNPILPSGTQFFRFRNLKVTGAALDISFERAPGAIRVSNLKPDPKIPVMVVRGSEVK
ncbi:MAG: hypothetical protein KGQ59_00885 [Bdellovibrionales bacterium]|nr:hypothetical protein [Bdellovibrionales bacterium]